MITHERSLKEFGNQIKYVLANYSSHGVSATGISNVVLGGLGGSGIAGAITKAWAYDKLKLPLETVSDYELPAWVSDRTLVILNSYSGNTEETLSMLAQATEAGAQVLILSSGGTISERATAAGLKLYPIEEGYQPRQTIGYGLGYLLMIVSELHGGQEGLDQCRDDLEEVIGFLETENDLQRKSAESIFRFFGSSLKNKFILIADRQFYPIALRFSQQLNENAKLEAFVHPLPESNHNVIESYVDRLPSNFILLYGTANPRVEARFDFLAGHLEMDNNKVLPLRIPRYDIVALFDMIYRLDWVSVMIAEETGAPLMEVPIISDLKEYLSNLEFVDEGMDTDEL